MTNTNNLTMEDLLEPLIDGGFDVKMTNDMKPTFNVKHNGKEATFSIGIDKVNISTSAPTAEGIISYYKGVVKELEKQVNAYDWKDL